MKEGLKSFEKGKTNNAISVSIYIWNMGVCD